MPASVVTTITGTVWIALATNMLLLVSCLPVVLLLVTTDPARSWPLLAMLAPLGGPAVVGAFRAFALIGSDGSGSGVLRTYLEGWRSAWRRAAAFTAGAVLALVVIGVDIRAVSSTPAGVVVIPLLIVLAVLVAMVTLFGLIGYARVPRARLRDIVRGSAVLGVRRLLLSLATLGVLGLQVLLFTQLPAVALGFTAAPLLYVVWANGSHILAPILPAHPTPSA